MKINMIDLFAGCGGLLDGFMREGAYNPVASVEWEKEPVRNLKNRLKTKWNIKDVEEKCLLMDIMKHDELFMGWENDDKYGSSKGLDYLVNKVGNIDLIIGGPPCQAYSFAGRIRDENGMRDDYRNYLFENYLRVVERYKPKFFIFENVPGILSSKPGDKFVVDLIKEELEKVGYEIIDDIKKYAVINMNEYGVPQNRKRVILLGVNKENFSEDDDNDIQEFLLDFYTSILPKYKSEYGMNVWDAIGDLPKLKPYEKSIRVNNKNFSHKAVESEFENHDPRYHNEGDVKVFKILTKDIEMGYNEYSHSNKLNELYKMTTGKDTKVHKYHVLRKNEPSTTILAHLHKDGLRFIHPDPDQARSITVREAARLQSFDDSYEFISAQGANYKMIGNAVPPEFAYRLACALKEII